MSMLRLLIIATAALALSAAPAHAAEYVLVDANADGDTPVAGGVVRVAGCHGRRLSAPIRRTARTGAALLKFAPCRRASTSRFPAGATRSSRASTTVAAG